MIYRLRYCNKDGVEARVDIRKGLATPVIDIEGTDNPFTLSYNNDKGNKSGMFLTSSADIEIYETPDFNIDNLKTSNETELSVTHYINNVVSWQGFIIPDFFSIEVRNNPVITMTASDRLGTLKNITLSDLPSMISLRELAILCLNKTGLTLPLKTMADFSNGTGVNDFFNSKILTQRLSDTKGRSISCYDILSSILTASNSFLVQRAGGWHIINKIQHEAGSGKLYTGATSFINWSDVIFNFSDISIGGRRTIIPVASTVGVFHEFGGGRVYPENYDFSLNLTGWTAVNGFVAVIDNRKVDNFASGTGVIPQEWTTNPVFGEPAEKKYLVNDNYGINYDFANKPYLRSSNIPVTYPNISQVKVNVEVNATGPYIDSETYRGETNFAVIASDGTSTLHLTGSGTFETLSGDPFLHKVLFDGDTHLQAVTSSRSVNGVLAVQEGNLSGYNITIRIYGYTKGFTGGRFLVTTLVNSVAVTITDISDEAKGILYKTERVDNFTKAHDIDTSLFADYLTTGLNGYFYSFPIDDTSLIYNSNNKLTTKWTAYNDPEQLPLLQHITRQRSRLFSVAHDLLSAEIEVSDFDPLAIFVSCGKRYTVVSAQFDFFKSNLSVELEEVAFQNATVRDFIYSYFGDGESGIKSIGGISGGGGSGSGGGLTPEQIEILSFWKKDPDNPNTIFTEMNAYSKLELSAHGVGTGGGGGGGSDYERLDTWASYDSSKSGWVLSAFLGNDLNTRVTNLENSGGSGGGSTVEWGTLTNGYRQLTVEGVTYALAQNTHKHLWADITDKPSTFTPSSHSHGWSEITGKPSTFAPSAHTHSASDISSGTFAIARIPTGTTGTTVALGNHLHTGVYEPVFSKNTAFNKDFGTTSGTVAQGNDSRIINGQTAFDWGNHSGLYLPLTGGTMANTNLVTNLNADLLNGYHADQASVPITIAVRDSNMAISMSSVKYSPIFINISTQGWYRVYSGYGSVENVIINIARNYVTVNDEAYSFSISKAYNSPPSIVQISGRANTRLITYIRVDYTTSAMYIDFFYNSNTINGIFISGSGRGDFQSPTLVSTPSGTITEFTTVDGVGSNFGFTGSLAGNAASATKLQTARTIWGQSFDGTGNITGALSGATTIAASISVASPKVIFNSAGWSMEQTGTELQLKYNNVVAQRFLLDGSIVGLGEITAYGSSAGGEGVALLRAGGTMTGNLTMSADIIMNSGRAIGVSNLPLKLLGNALTYNASNVLTEANTATQIKMGNGWTIEQTTSALTIKKNGVVRGTFNA